MCAGPDAGFDVACPAAARAGVLVLAVFDADGALVIERAVPQPFEQTPIFRGSLGDALPDVGVDHRARYLLLLVRHDGSVALHRLENRPGAVPELGLQDHADWCSLLQPD